VEKIKLWVSKADLDWAIEMQSEAYTRTIMLSTYPIHKTDICVEIKEAEPEPPSDVSIDF